MPGEMYASLIGGAIAGAFSVLAVVVQNKANEKAKLKSDRREVSGYLNAIRTEIGTLWNRYNASAGRHLEGLASGKEFSIVYPVASDYFTVCAGSASLLGRVESDEVRQIVVETYTNARGIIDSFRLNNEMLHGRENYVLLFAQTGHAEFQQRANELSRALSEYAGDLKERHVELREQAQRLEQVLSKALAS